MHRIAVWLGLAVAMLAFDADAQRMRFDPIACEPEFCSESDWIPDDAASDHTTAWRHGLRATPRYVSILFSPDGGRGPVYPLLWPWQWQTTGNPQGLEMTGREIRLHIWSGAPLHGIWRPGEGWTTWREGYWKIIAYR